MTSHRKLVDVDTSNDGKVYRNFGKNIRLHQQLFNVPSPAGCLKNFVLFFEYCDTFSEKSSFVAAWCNKVQSVVQKEKTDSKVILTQESNNH